MDCILKNVQCHTLPVGHRIRCAYQKMWNVTHTLLIIGQDVMSVPGRISTHILSAARWDLMSTILWKKEAAYGLWNGIMRWMIRLKCSVTNFLLAMTWNFLVIKFCSRKKVVTDSLYSLCLGETNMDTITHFLSKPEVIWKWLGWSIFGATHCLVMR